MTNKKPLGGVVCHYCHNLGHVRRNCRQLQNTNRRFQFVHYLKSLKFASTSITILVESSKTNTCFISSSFTWVIDSRATDQMTGNCSVFTTFQSHLSTSTITLADGSTLSLPKFSFNLIYVSKLTRTLNCNILFFLDYCFIQDLSMKRIIGRGCESGDLYILETEVPKSIACSRVVTPFDLHCCLGHPSLSLLKKLYPQFSSLSSFN